VGLLSFLCFQHWEQLTYRLFGRQRLVDEVQMGLELLAESFDQQVLGGLLGTLLLLHQLPDVLRNVEAEQEAQDQADDEVVIPIQGGNGSPHVSNSHSTPSPSPSVSAAVPT